MPSRVSRLSAIAVLLSSLVLAPPAGADEALMLRQRIIVASSTEAPREQAQYFSSSLRISDDDRWRTITDLERKTVTFIRKTDKTYDVQTFAELEKRTDRHDDRVKDLPPQVRELVNADDAVQIVPTGKSEQVAGYEAKEYAVTGKGVVGSVWIAESLDLGPRADDWSRLADVFGGRSTPGGQLERALGKIKGVPLRRTLTMQPLPLVTTEVVEVRRGPIPRDLTRVPEGFTKKAPPAPKAWPTPAR